MLKCFFFFLLLLFGIVSFGQTNQVFSIEYEKSWKPSSSINTSVRTYRLLTDASSYKYEFIEDNTIVPRNFSLVSKDEQFVSYHIGSRFDSIDYHYTNKPYVKNRDYMVVDSLPSLKWDITNQKLELGSYNCTRAETIYRGRFIVAYFTEEIPINIGPNNLNGLPGAILLAYSHDNEFTFTAKKIESIPRPDTFFKYEIFEFGNLITLREYVKISQNRKEKDVAVLQSRFESQLKDKGATEGTVTGAKVSSLSGNLELFYEWEIKK